MQQKVYNIFHYQITFSRMSIFSALLGLANKDPRDFYLTFMDF